MNPQALGVTGTRNPLTTAQHDQMATFLRSWRNKYNELHHGSCVGADEAMVIVGALSDYYIIAHPPEIETYLSEPALTMSNVMLPSKPYLSRNRDIVDSSALLLALPFWPEDALARAGTWATVRYARNLKRPITIIYQDGEVREENIG